LKKLLRRAALGLTGTAVVLALSAMWLTKAHMYRVYGGRVDRVAADRFPSSPASAAITNVSVLAPDGASFIADQTVVIGDGLILSVDADDTMPSDAFLIDGTDHYLIPGLIDAHVHLRQQPNDLLLYLANGVTTVRDLSGSPDALRWREEVEAGRAGPRLAVASPQLYTSTRIDGWFRDFTRSSRNVQYRASSENLVVELVNTGYDALKLYDNIDLDAHREITAAARAQGVHTVGHLPRDFPLEELRRTPQRELAHIEEIVKPLLTEFGAFHASGGGDAFLRLVRHRTPGIVDDLIANDVAVNTTLWLMDTLEGQATDLRETLRALPLEYANPAMVEGSEYIGLGWLPGRNRFELPADADDATVARTRDFFRARVEAQRILLREMASRGVTITAGTDATTELMIPGFSLHSELESLERAGLTPSQALRSATLAAADVLGSDAGAIEAGRPADVLLLRENPLADPSATRSIAAVFSRGRYYPRAELDSMLAAVAAAHAESRRWSLGDYR